MLLRPAGPGPRPPPPWVLPGDAPPLKKAERTILNVLAQFPEGRTKVQIAILAGYSVKSGGFRNALGTLRSAGLAVGTDPVQITQEGIAAAGAVTPLPTGQALLEHWLHNSGLKKAERTILEYLHRVHVAVGKAELAQEVGYSVTSGGFRNALGKLRTLELIHGTDPLMVSDVLR